MDNLIIYKQKHCVKCDKNVSAKLVRLITANCISQVYWQCQDHMGGIDSPRKNIKHDVLARHDIDIDRLPIVENYSEKFVCVVCGKIGAENHHWAPRYLFGDECDSWPQSDLCRGCHQRWHDLVTPGMCEHGKL